MLPPHHRGHFGCDTGRHRTQHESDGAVAIFDKYANYLAQTGDIVCTTTSSVSATFFSDSVTYADNTKEKVEYTALPYPVFEGGERVALQRGGGMCVIKSDAKKEYAAGVFLKWLTEPEQNLRFVAHTGYMPVTEEAFGSYVAREVDNIENGNIKKMMEAVAVMQRDYTFYFPPVFSGFEDLQLRYKRDLLNTAGNARREYLNLSGEQGPDAAYEAVSQGLFERFVSEH